MNAMDSALAFAIASYAVSEPTPAPIVTVTVAPQKLVKVSRPAKVQPVVATTEQEAPMVSEEPKAPIGNIKLPEKGSLEAAGYFKMMRCAKDRNDKIFAIAAFNGYDWSKDYGEQETAANFAAKRQLSPIDTTGPSRQELRSAQRSLAGYVKGMPDNQQKMLRDLQGREQLAVATMLDHQKAASEALEAGSAALHSHHLGLALLEKERVEAIQADISKMIG